MPATVQTLGIALFAAVGASPGPGRAVPDAGPVPGFGPRAPRSLDGYECP